ncbi:ArsR/SmtB family transcription factor [Lacticaseibacillus saniviri]|uniref:HTH arsR-type domain-containing protein n=1 Tax=Lacticaseibacillus saniviri JCM 17471 = DSM 24301 TaxID=1293598 RepID=A0A0R2MN90_9LACO|nr:metalloregulator ArsR/SmtB family transcription factor [Lacticaseibacillus saniviri]KRO15169.1 hypothetical protein IV56_GL000260 [Lacticaseibacillus saniviri JCM 17471 = DSM 24301]MCG4281690.1 metalloregulator ArsR/SmtB family transcription factor [Lacticaseibacillus saniviri]
MTDFHGLEIEFTDVSPFLTALGDTKRQAIIVALINDIGHVGMQVTDLTELLGLSRPAVSHHLKILRDAHLIEYRTEGTKNYYRLSHDLTEIRKLQELLAHVTTIIEGSNRS